MTIANRRYSRKFLKRVQAILANHGLYMVGLFLAHQGIPARDALALVQGGRK